MLDKKQEQRVDQGSIAIQAGGNVHIGLSYEEVRQVARDVFDANFYRLSEVAAKEARARAEEVTEKFLSKLQREYPQGLAKAYDPDFQYALFNVQKEYARSGDDNLGDLLVDLLVERSKCDQRDLKQIVLNEAIVTAPKLTKRQFDVLSVIFLFKYTMDGGINSHQRLGEHFDTYIAPFIPNIVHSYASYQHLEFAGCGQIEISSTPLESILANYYQGLFMRGFESDVVRNMGISIGVDDTRFFTKCLNDPSKFQVNALNKESLDNAFASYAVSPEDQVLITQLFDSNKMNDIEIRNKCIEIRPYMSEVFRVWSETPMQNFTLTSVGMALGHANIMKTIGRLADLSIWIHELPKPKQ